ncbi:MAG: pyridoxamine 5'-phosphate oxidase family protein [Solirubrobacteraceae bacterium]
MHDGRPGSSGEHALQERHGTASRAAAFYDKQTLDHLTPQMREYLGRQEMMFISTADADGECDASFRAGPAGFVRVLDDRTLLCPEYRGNGVMASLGNISENPQVGLLFLDFFHSGVGLHVNGRAQIVEHGAVEGFGPLLRRLAGVQELYDPHGGKAKVPDRWILVDVVEAYVHCSKHIPILAHLPGNANQAPPSGDYFEAKDVPRPWTRDEAEPAELTATAQELTVTAHELTAGAQPRAGASIVAGIESFLDDREPAHDDETLAPSDVAPAPASSPAPLDELARLLPEAWASMGDDA